MSKYFRGLTITIKNDLFLSLNWDNCEYAQDNSGRQYEIIDFCRKEKIAYLEPLNKKEYVSNNFKGLTKVNI